MRRKFATAEDVELLLRATARKYVRDSQSARQPVKQESTPMAYEQLDALSDRIARRVSEAMRTKQPGQYQGKREQDLPGFQGMYMDEQFKLDGLFEREHKRLFGQ